jgi:hypothetical protein
MHLSEQWQKHCRDALLQSVDEENGIEGHTYVDIYL